MLRDIDKTLEKLLYERGNISRQDVEIAFDQPTGDWSARINKPTINCWAFDLRENLQRRTAGVKVNVDRSRNQATKQFPARRMDVTYLISTWATEVEDEHRLLWRALSTLKRMPLWRPEDCVEDLRYQTQNMPIVVADMNDSPVNLPDLWGVMENSMKLGFIFRVTVELELDEMAPAPLVLTSTIKVGESERPRTNEQETDVEIDLPSTRAQRVRKALGQELDDGE